MRVFKYRGGTNDVIKRDIRSLFQNEIYAAPLDKLNDLFEANFSLDDQTFHLESIFEELGLSTSNSKMDAGNISFLPAIQAFADFIKTCGVYSLSKTPTDELLWAYYADAHRGFCLEYEFEELFSYKLTQQGWTEVRYQTEAPKITFADVIPLDETALLKKFIGTKSKRWEHESEVRVVTGQIGSFEYDYRALKAIYFGARSTAWLRRRVMRAMSGRGLNYYEVKPNGTTYELKESHIADAFEREVTYRKRTAPVAENIPYWDNNSLPYKSELLRAIEIVRREPYCEQVTNAYVSSKSTLENPVFYVTYDRSDGLPKNFYLTKVQIDAMSPSF